MMYSVGTAMRNLRRNAGVYLPVVFLTAICVSVICFLLSGLMSFISHHKSVLLKPEASDYFIIVDPLYDAPKFEIKGRKEAGNADRAPVTEADLHYLETECGDIRVKLKVEYLHRIYLENGLFETNVYYLSDNYFEEAGVEPCVIIADEVLEILKALPEEGWEEYLRQFKCDYDAATDTFVSFKGNRFPILRASQFDMGKLDMTNFYERSTDEEYDVARFAKERGIFVPIQALYDSYIDGTTLSLRILSDGDPSGAARALKYLTAEHWDAYSYSLNTTSELILSEIYEQRQALTVLLPGTALLLIVVGVSFLGIQIIQFERNKRGLAVSMTLGATPSGLALETVIKAVVPPLIGGAAGCAIASIIMGQLKLTLLQAKLTPSFASIAASLMLCALLGVLSCLPTIRRLKKLSPISVLKDSVV